MVEKRIDVLLNYATQGGAALTDATKQIKNIQNSAVRMTKTLTGVGGIGDYLNLDKFKQATSEITGMTSKLKQMEKFKALGISQKNIDYLQLINSQLDEAILKKRAFAKAGKGEEGLDAGQQREQIENERGITKLMEAKAEHLTTLGKKIRKVTIAQDMKNKIDQTAAQRMKQLNKGLLTAGLGMLFFGMALKKFFEGMAKSLFKTYLEVTDNTNIVTQQVHQLSAAFEFLKFSIVESLSESDLFLNLMTRIIDITNAVSKFVAEHPGVARFLLAFIGIGVVVGALLMIFGQMHLGVLAIVSAWGFLQTAIAAPAAAAALTFIVANLWWIIAIVALVAAAFATNFGNIRGFVTDTFGVIWETVKSVFKNIKDGVNGVWLIIKGIFTGDFEMVWRGMIDIATNAIAMIVKAFLGLGAAVVNIGIFMSNMLKDALLGTVNLIIGAIRGLIRAANKIPGVHLNTTGFDKAIDYVDTLKKKLTSEYISGDDLAKTLGFVDKIEDVTNKWLGGSEAFKEAVDTTADVVKPIEGGVMDNFLDKLTMPTLPESVMQTANQPSLSAQDYAMMNLGAAQIVQPIEVTNNFSGTIFGMDDFEDTVKKVTGETIDEVFENSTINVGTPNSPLGLN